MDTTSSSGNDVNNSTPEAAVTWVESKVKSHELSPNSGRLWTVAVNALAALRREDEPRDSASMLDMMAELERRWCIANDDSKGDTGRTYASRARAALRAHIRFLEDPSGFKFETRPRPDAPTRKKAERRSEPRHDEPAPPVEPAAALCSIPIPGKGDFRFERPGFKLSQADVMRIAWGLCTYCEDFEPGVTWNPGTGIVPQGAPAQH